LQLFFFWCRVHHGLCTEIYRVGVVEPVTTPPITDGFQRRLSGHLSLIGVETTATATATATPGEEDDDDEDDDEEENNMRVSVRERIKSESSLQMPSAGLTRSSYMTNSTNASRMSGLSDFPVPPTADMATHIKLLDAYFDGPPRMIGVGGDASTLASGGGSPMQPVSRRMTFGGDEDIEDIAKSLSSPRQSP
jgi:serine/arginine repetitive matrix protein 2